MSKFGIRTTNIDLEQNYKDRQDAEQSKPKWIDATANGTQNFVETQAQQGRRANINYLADRDWVDRQSGVSMATDDYASQGYTRVAVNIPCPEDGWDDCVVYYKGNHGESLIWDDSTVYMLKS